MANKSSTAGHIPARTCVICKTKKSKPEMFRFGVCAGEYVIDCRQSLAGRGYYLCRQEKCLEGLDKWISKTRRKKKTKKQ